MYKLRTSENVLRLPLDNRIKQVHAITLLGYKLGALLEADNVAHHETKVDDYAILHVEGVNGKVMSNVPAADGAFAVLRLNAEVENRTMGETVEHSHYDPKGIVTQRLETTHRMRELVVHIKNAAGEPMRTGRAHLWFRLQATCA